MDKGADRAGKRRSKRRKGRIEKSRWQGQDEVERGSGFALAGIGDNALPTHARLLGALTSLPSPLGSRCSRCGLEAAVVDHPHVLRRREQRVGRKCRPLGRDDPEANGGKKISGGAEEEWRGGESVETIWKKRKTNK